MNKTPKIRTTTHVVIAKNNKLRLRFGTPSMGEKVFGVRLDLFIVSSIIDTVNEPILNNDSRLYTEARKVNDDGSISEISAAEQTNLGDAYFVDKDSRLCYLLNGGNARYIWLRAKEITSTFNFYSEQSNSLGVAYYDPSKDKYTYKDYSKNIGEIQQWITDMEIDLLHYHTLTNQTNTNLIDQAHSSLETETPYPKDVDVYMCFTEPYLLQLTLYIRED